jgi:uncharacterized protein (DUF1015 family)
VGGLANVTSPPYDVIGPGTLEHLLAASPFNVVRLILPARSISSGELSARDAGQIAAARLRDWLTTGALAADPEPALYVYEQRGDGWQQRGLIGLVEVGTGAVLPHEGVMPGPVAGRRELMKATRSNLEPILLVYGDQAGAGEHGGTERADTRGPADAGAASRLVDLAAETREALASAVTDDGVTHRLWALTDPAEHAAIAADLATRTALIADGHHRYAAYEQLREELDRPESNGLGPWDSGLAFLVDADAYPLRLGAIHRVLPHLAPAWAATQAAAAFTVTERPDCELRAGLESLERAGKAGTAFLLAGGGRCWLLSEPNRRRLAAAMPAGTSPRWQALDAAVMQELLLADLWSVTDNERDVLISHDAEEAVMMAAESGGTAVLCNPMPLAAVMEIAAHGEKVPRKSTSFGPKPRTGLVLRTLLFFRLILRGCQRAGQRAPRRPEPRSRRC